MGLEEILQELGAEKPFDDKPDGTGEYTEAGLCACAKLLRIGGGQMQIGALGKTGDELENYLDEIVRLGF